MKKYLAPLGIFVGGHILMLFAYLFLSHIGTVVDTLQTDTAAIASTFWNWTWLSGAVVQFLIYLVMELLILFATAKAFLAIR